MTEITKANERLERKQVSDALTAVEDRATDIEQVIHPDEPASYPHTLDADGEVARVDLNGASKTVNLPATLTAGRIYGVHCINTGSAGYTLTLGRNSHTLRYGGVTNGDAGGGADDWTLTDRGTILVVAVSSSVAEAIGVTTEA